MVSPEIQQLQDQQGLLTNALRMMLEGAWCGAPPSVQAFVSALDPSLDVQCVPPYRESDQPPAPPDYLARYDPNCAQPAQTFDWTCANCSLDWLKRALGLVDFADIYASRALTLSEIGYPENINETYGLMDGSGAALQDVLYLTYHQSSNQDWLTFDQAYSIFAQTPGMMSGGTWYHWVGVRGTVNGSLHIANSAPGYQGVWDVLSREDFNRLGPFSCVWCVA